MSRKTPEGKVQKKCLDYLDKLISDGLPITYEVRTGQGGYNYKKGKPDFFIVVGPYHVEVEVKAADGELSALQEKNKWLCEKRGTPYFNPHDADEFKVQFNMWLKGVGLLK